MKTIRFNSFLLPVCAAILSMAPLADAAGTTYWSGAGGAGNQNWSSAVNWTAAGGSAPPAAGDAVIFKTTGSQAAAGTIDNNVDAGFTVAIGSLWCSNDVANTFHTTQIPTGNTLTVNGPIIIGTNNQTATYTFTGGGTLKGGTGTSQFALATLNGGTLTFDLTALTNFVYNAGGAGGAFVIGQDAGASSGGVMKLASVSNNITATTLTVANNNTSGTSTLNLGAGTNIINAGTIEMGDSKSTGTIQFNSATGGFRLRNAAGTGRATVDMAGTPGHSGSASTAAIANILLKGHTVDMMISTLTMANRAARPNSTATANFSFDAGIVDVTAINMAINASGGAAANANLAVGGGTLKVANSISLVNFGGTAGTGSLIITNGSTVIVGNILKTTSTGTGIITVSGSTLTMSSLGSAIGTPSAPIDSLSLSNATLHLAMSAALTDAKIIATTVITNGLNTIVLDSVIGASGTVNIPLISYTGTDPFSSLALNTSALPAGYSAVLDDSISGTVQLIVTAPVASALVWVGATNSLLVSNWDTNKTKNWIDAATLSIPQVYGDPDTVLFDDTASNSVVTLMGPVNPLSVTFNSSALSYVLNGAGKITGVGSLTNLNNGTVKLADTGGDNFSGGIAVNAGTLILDNAGSAISGGWTVAPGAKLQIGNNDANGALPSGALDDEGTLVINRSDNFPLAIGITGGGSLAQTGNGTLTLSASNSYTGSTVASKGTLVLTGNGMVASSSGLLVSNATFDVSAIISRSTVLNDFNVTNAILNVNPTNLQIPITTTTLEADGIIAHSNVINVLGLPPVAFYPSTITLVKSANPITLTAGNFNFALGTLPAASPAYAGSLTESANGTAIQLTLTAGPVGTRASTTWAAINNTSTTTNWSGAVNWQLPGVPGAGDNVIFDDTTEVSDGVTINNFVDGGFAGTVSSLTYAQTNSAFQNTLIASGSTLNVTGTGGLTVGVVNQLGTAASPVTTIWGPGAALVVNNASANVNVSLGEPGTAGTATLNMTNLDTFSFTGARLLIGVGGPSRSSGVVHLARTNTIIMTGATAPQLDVGDNGNNNGPGSTLYLGQTNVIYADNIAVGRTKQNTGNGGNLRFDPVFTNSSPVAYFRGANGVNAVATWAISDGTTGGGTITDSGIADFTGGIVDAVVTNMWLGRIGSGANAGSSSCNGTLIFNAGSIVVNNLTNAMLTTSAQTPTTTGKVFVNGGKLTVNNAIVMAALNGFTGTANATLSVTNGTVQTGGIIMGGGNTTINLNAGTLIVTNSVGTLAAPLTTLDLDDLSVIQMNVTVGVTNIVATTVNINSGITTLNINSISGVTGTTEIPLISYTGTSPMAGVALGTTPTGYTGASLVDSGISIDLIITPPAPLVWNGKTNTVLVANWDTSTFNWLNGATPSTYADIDFVQFDDTGKTNVATLLATVSPAGLDVSNNTVNYTFNGAGKISGLAGLVKQGNAKLVVDNSGINDFSGGINIGGGTVQFGNNDANGTIPANAGIIDNGTLAFGRTDSNTVANLISGTGGVTQTGSGTNKLTAANSYGGATLISGGTIIFANAGAATGNSSIGAIPGGAVTITNGGTLDLGGIATANIIGFTNASGQSKQFYIAGAGAAGNGAIVNNGSVNQQDAFQLITLTANATVGGPARWDMRGNALITPVLDLGGFTLTKNGSNQMSMVNLIVTNGGSIVINQGILSFETTSSNSTAAITVNAGGVLGHFRENATLFTAPITLNGGMIRDLNGTPGSTNDSPITLTANSFLDLNVNSTDLLQLNGVIAESGGSFGLTKTNIGTYALSATNTYSGTTLVQQGKLLLVGGGSITNSKSVIVAAGATLDASQRGDSTFTLNKTQTLSGFGTVNGTVVTVSGSTVAPGSASTVGTLALNGNTTLGGTNLMKVSRASGATNDIVSVGGALQLGGTLTVTSLGGSYVNGDTFTLFNATGGITGTFTATNLPAIPGFGWVTANLANGVLSIVATVNTSPTNITTKVTGNVLTLSWPADHVGWRLQAQTNSLASGLNPATNAWFDVAGSTGTNSVNAVLNPANGTVFYRMVYP